MVFDYQASRSGEHAKTFLEGWAGALMVDDYAGYKALFRSGEIIELACWAHARRKFFELQAQSAHPLAAAALIKIGELYAIEREAQGFTSEARAALRAHAALPRLEALQAWLLATRSTVAPGSGIAKAIDYSLKRWSALVRYAQSGHLPIVSVQPLHLAAYRTTEQYSPPAAAAHRCADWARSAVSPGCL